MLISRLLNKGSYEINVFLNRAIIRVTTEEPIFYKARCIFPHRLKISFDINTPSSAVSFLVGVGGRWGM